MCTDIEERNVFAAKIVSIDGGEQKNGNGVIYVVFGNPQSASRTPGVLGLLLIFIDGTCQYRNYE